MTKVNVIYIEIFIHQLVVDRKICEKTSIDIIYNKKEKNEEKNSEQVFSYYIQ